MMREGISVSFLLEHTEKPLVVSSEDGVDSFIDSLLDMPHDRNCATVYSLDRPLLPSGFYDHEMVVGIDKIAQVGVIKFAEYENYVSRGSVDHGVGEYMLLGHAKEFMPKSEISIDSVRRAVKEFLKNWDRIPSCIQWQLEEW